MGKRLPSGKELEAYVHARIGPYIWPILWRKHSGMFIALFVAGARSRESGQSALAKPPLRKQGRAKIKTRAAYIANPDAKRKTPKSGKTKEFEYRRPGASVSSSTVAEYRKLLKTPEAENKTAKLKPEDSRLAVYKLVKLPRQNYDEST
jgi:hypothetical protein